MCFDQDRSYEICGPALKIKRGSYKKKIQFFFKEKQNVYNVCFVLFFYKNNYNFVVRALLFYTINFGKKNNMNK